MARVRHDLRTNLAKSWPLKLSCGEFSPVGTPLRESSSTGVLDAEHASARLPRSTIRRLRACGAVAAPDRSDVRMGAMRSGVPLEMPGCSTREDRIVQSIRAGWSAWASPPPVSVVLPLHRLDDLQHSLSQLAGQQGVAFELIVGLHGDHWPGGEVIRPSMCGASSVSVLRFATEIPFGTILNRMTAEASSEVITKWDGDDWYGPNHLLDLTQALTYSEADIVGKAAEFVRLELSDVTLRRDQTGGLSFDSTIAGGTLMLARSTVLAAGGWSDGHRHVDRFLLDRIHRSGGWSFRAHGREYVLRRAHDHQHTWAAPDAYFLRKAGEVWPGLALHEAGITI